MKKQQQKTQQWSARLVVRGTPRPQPRPRFAGGHVVSTVDPGVRAWQAWVRAAAMEAMAGGGGIPAGVQCLQVDVEFYLGTPKADRWGRVHWVRPDRDNLDKLVLDELTRVGFLGGDDCRAGIGTIAKWWCPPASEGCIVTVYDAGELRGPANGIDSRPESETPPGWLFGE